MSVLDLLNSGTMYLICGAIVLFVAGVCVFFMVRAWRAGIAIGMDKTKTHTSLVFRGATYGEFGTTNGNNMTAQLLHELQSEIFDFVRNEKQFTELVTRLESTAVRGSL